MGHQFFNRTPAAAGRLLVLAGFMASAGLASAQSSVQVFGIIDAGILTQSKTGTSNKSNTRLETSGLRQSVWGFKGTEDLGGGLKAFFNLESHFDTDNGHIHGTGDSNQTGTILFRRQANVGLSSDWGTVILGRQYGPALLAHIGTEPRAFKEQFSNLYAWAYNQLDAFAGAGAAGNTNDVGIFMSNAVQYRNTFGPVTVGVLYAFGEQAGKISHGNTFALGGTYNGPVTLSASFQEMKDKVTGEDIIKQYGLGGAVPFGDFTFKVNYMRGENKAANGDGTSKVNGISGGVDWKWSPSNSATLAYYDNKDEKHHSNHTKNIVISNDLFLSKRTTIYTQVAIVDASSGATGIEGLKTSIVADGSFKPNATTTFLNVGINHTF
ncbi:MAG: porin [Rhizobacter sp.]